MIWRTSLADLSGGSASLRIRGLVQRRDDRSALRTSVASSAHRSPRRGPVWVGRPDALGHATDDTSTTRGATPSESYGSHAARENRPLEHDDWHKRCFAAWTERLIGDVARECKRQRASLLASLPDRRFSDPEIHLYDRDMFCVRFTVISWRGLDVERSDYSASRIMYVGRLESLPEPSRCSRVILKPFSTRVRSDLEMTTRCKGPSNMQ
jgi:hypothetical protein